jgi:hypothetical protein
MPHAGLMDEKGLGPVAGPLQRARLHLRGGRRRLRQGNISAGIATLFDALQAAMQYFAADPKNSSCFQVREGENLNKDATLYAVLVRSNAVDGTFDFTAFDRLVEKALNEAMPGYEYKDLLAGIESVMTQLGVMPFDEASLPPEDPKTL